MKSCVTDNPITTSDSAVAYLFAVTSAALAIIILMALKSPEPISKQTLFIFLAAWLFVFFSALIPYIAGIVIANRYKISHWSYFIGGSTMTASFLTFSLLAIPELGINVVVPEPSYWEKYFSALIFFAPCGVISGAICWWFLCKGESSV